MAIAPNLLDILVCPETRAPLKLADRALLETLNAKAAAGTLTNRKGERVTEPLEEGLVRSDGAVLYPVRRDIPVMMADEAIPLDQSGR